MSKIWETLKFRGENVENYEVSTEGEIRNKKTGRILKGKINRDGYHEIGITIKGKSRFLLGHRAVAWTFFENPHNFSIVNHKDRCRINNKVENLEWVTSRENNRHSLENGRKRQFRAVNQIDKDTGEIIQTFDSITEAAKHVGGTLKGISGCANGYYQHHTSVGFKWKFVVEKEKPPLDCNSRDYGGYKIFSNGKIANKNRVLKAMVHSGYQTVMLTIDGKKVNKYVHRLVALYFIPNNDQNKNVVNHKDGNRLNNDVSNLEWTTYKGNADHAVNVLGKHNKRPVSQYDLDGNFMRSYGSVREASIAIGIKYDGSISMVCSGYRKRKTAHGYIWKYDKSI